MSADKPRFGDTVTFAIGGMKHKGSGLFAKTQDGAPIEKLSYADLGLDDDADVVWADLTWQFTERWQVSLSYSSFDGSGFNLATKSGNFGDLDWEVGAALTSNLDMELLIADVTWDFLKTEKGHLGIGAGLHAADIDFDLLVEVGAQIGGGAIGGTIPIGYQAANVVAPLPNLSFVGGYTFGERVYVGCHLGYLSLSYDKYDGELFSARGMVEWRPWEHFGLGAAYQYVDINFEVDRSRSTERFDVRFYGPVLFLSVGF